MVEQNNESPVLRDTVASRRRAVLVAQPGRPLTVLRHNERKAEIPTVRSKFDARNKVNEGDFRKPRWCSGGRGIVFSSGRGWDSASAAP
jgi:hypothetical protein